ncbi:MAG: DUF692 family protein [Candidatus Omnitrophica bacterium]|nr:DUF692 family protein [Candidatus Omnitrophota bacterium]
MFNIYRGIVDRSDTEWRSRLRETFEVEEDADIVDSDIEVNKCEFKGDVFINGSKISIAEGVTLEIGNNVVIDNSSLVVKGRSGDKVVIPDGTVISYSKISGHKLQFDGNGRENFLHGVYSDRGFDFRGDNLLYASLVLKGEKRPVTYSQEYEFARIGDAGLPAKSDVNMEATRRILDNELQTHPIEDWALPVSGQIDHNERKTSETVVPAEKTAALMTDSAKLPEGSILVTGATGFIGSNFVKMLLLQERKVAASVREGSANISKLPVGHKNLFTINADLLKPDYNNLMDAVSVSSTVYHFGAFSDHKQCDDDPAGAFVTNTITTGILARMSGEAGKRFLFASTFGVYELSDWPDGVSASEVPGEELLGDDSLKQWLAEAEEEFKKYIDQFMESRGNTAITPRAFVEKYLTENPIPRPEGMEVIGFNYPMSKLLAEQLTLVEEKGVVMRLGNFYGPGQYSNYKVPRIISDVFYTPDGMQCGVWPDKRDFMCIDDLNKILKGLGEVDIPTDERIMNISTGTSVTTRKIAEIIAGILERNIGIVIDKTGYNKVPSYNLGSDRMQKLTGITEFTPIEEGMVSTVEHYAEFYHEGCSPEHLLEVLEEEFGGRPVNIYQIVGRKRYPESAVIRTLRKLEEDGLVDVTVDRNMNFYSPNRVNSDFSTRACKLFNRFNIICGFSLNASKDPRNSENSLFKRGLEQFRDIFALSKVVAPYSFEDQCRSAQEVDRIHSEELFDAPKRTFHIRKMRWGTDEKVKNKYYSMDLVDSETSRIFADQKSPLYVAIGCINPEFVSIHLGSSSENVSYGGDNQGVRPFNVGESRVLTREETMKKIVDNINMLQDNLKRAGYDKPVLLETLDYHQTGAYAHVTHPAFVKEVLEKTGAHLLIDCAHLFCSAKNMAGWKERPYMDYVREIVNEKTIGLVSEVHLTVPAPNTTHDKAVAGDYLDYHLPFFADTPEGDAVRNILVYMLQLRAYKRIVEPVVINFETDVEEAIAHVKSLVETLEAALEGARGDSQEARELVTDYDAVAENMVRNFDSIMEGTDAYRLAHARKAIESFDNLVKGNFDSLYVGITSKIVKEKTPDKELYFNLLREVYEIYDRLSTEEKKAMRIAVILHDLGYATASKAFDHWENGAREAVFLLQEYGIEDKRFIDNVVEAIRHHGKIGDMGIDVQPETLKDLTPAEKDQLLIISVIDTLSKLERKKEPPFASDNILSTEFLLELLMLHNYLRDEISEDEYRQWRSKCAGIKRAFQMSQEGLELDDAELDYVNKVIWGDETVSNMWENKIVNGLFPLFKVLRRSEGGGLTRVKKLHKLMRFFSSLAGTRLEDLKTEGPIVFDIAGKDYSDDFFRRVLGGMDALFTMKITDITLETIRKELVRTDGISAFGLNFVFHENEMLIYEIGSEIISDPLISNVAINEVAKKTDVIHGFTEIDNKHMREIIDYTELMMDKDESFKTLPVVARIVDQNGEVVVTTSRKKLDKATKYGVKAVHAEVQAIREAEEKGFNDWENATMYINIDSCFACSKVVTEFYGFKRVVYGIEDPTLSEYSRNKEGYARNEVNLAACDDEILREKIKGQFEVLLSKNVRDDEGRYSAVHAYNKVMPDFRNEYKKRFGEDVQVVAFDADYWYENKNDEKKNRQLFAHLEWFRQDLNSKKSHVLLIVGENKKHCEEAKKRILADYLDDGSSNIFFEKDRVLIYGQDIFAQLERAAEGQGKYDDHIHAGREVNVLAYLAYKSEFARNHAQRVERIALLLAREMDGVSEQMMGEISIACAVHDLDTPEKTEHVSPEAGKRVREKFEREGISLPKQSRNKEQYAYFLKMFAKRGNEFTPEDKDFVLDLFEPCAALRVAEDNGLKLSDEVKTAVLFHHDIGELENYLEGESWDRRKKEDTIRIASVLVAADTIEKGMNLFKRIFLNMDSKLEMPDDTRDYLKSGSKIPNNELRKILDVFDRVKDSEEFKEIAKDARKISGRELQDLKKMGRDQILSDWLNSREIDNVTKLFEIVEGEMNNRRDMIVAEANKVVSFLRERGGAAEEMYLTPLSRDTTTPVLIGQLKAVADEGRKYTEVKPIFDAVDYIKKNLDFLEVDSIVTSIIIRARKAARAEKTISVALDLSWIPGYSEDKIVRDMVNPVVNKLFFLESALKSMELDNVHVFVREWDDGKNEHEPVSVWAQRVAGDLVIPRDFSDVIVFGGMEAVDHFESKWEKENIDLRKRAFLSGVDSSGMDMNTLPAGYYWDIEIMQMLSAVFEAFTGKDVSKIAYIDKTRSDLAKRLLVFLPGAKKEDIKLMIDKFKAERKALMAV